MRCPDEIAEILVEILAVGLLRVRAAGSAGDAVACAAEADHLHNLPGLLSEYREELLRHYWDVERTAFIRRADGASVEAFAEAWGRLEKCMSRREIPA